MTVWNNGVEVESLYYTYDLQKNVTALFGQAAGRRTRPLRQPHQHHRRRRRAKPYRYSSEYYDEDLGLIYCNCLNSLKLCVIY